MNGLLPVSVVVREKFGPMLESFLFPEELAVVAHAVPQRRQEFAAVRECARNALRELRVPPAPLVPGERGAPVWPFGVVGSMTHCPDYCAAAVATKGDVVSLGIDAERHAPLPAGVLDFVALPEERTRLQALAAKHTDLCWDRLLFSAKEAVYKAWSPLARCWLDFEDVFVCFDPDHGTFTVDVRHPVMAQLPFDVFRGGWRIERDLIFTAVACSPPSE